MVVPKAWDSSLTPSYHTLRPLDLRPNVDYIFLLNYGAIFNKTAGKYYMLEGLDNKWKKLSMI